QESNAVPASGRRARELSGETGKVNVLDDIIHDEGGWSSRLPRADSLRYGTPGYVLDTANVPPLTIQGFQPLSRKKRFSIPGCSLKAPHAEARTAHGESL